jgi:hypothetical protein
MQVFSFKQRWERLVTFMQGKLFFALGMILVVLVFWQGMSYTWLHVLSADRAVEWMYRDLRHRAKVFQTGMSNSITPNELKAIILGGITNPVFSSIHSVSKRVPGETDIIIESYIKLKFSRTPPDRSNIHQTVFAWWHLKWRFLLINCWIGFITIRKFIGKNH